MNTEILPPHIHDFLLDLAQRDVSPRTRATYRADLLLFARWFHATTGEPFTAAAITPTDIKDHRAHLLTVRRQAAATVNRRLAALRAFCRWAKDRRLITELPTDGVKDVARPRQAPRSLEKRQVDALIRVVERRGKKRDIALIHTLRHTGIRVSELVALRVGDVVVGERKGSLTVRTGKGQKQRTLPLNVEARRTLAQYLALRNDPPADTYLFPSQKGGGLTTKAVEDLVRNYARLAGLEDVTPHTLRHSFAKHLLDAGEPLPTVAAALGHENLNTTAIYTQPSARDLERTVGRLAWEDET